ncbi:MAG TPA: hypothetical protein ENN40_02445 [Candidatus Aminicenantes bacterium]|nr:hypothetical protein [Candidatus Aminicenantes bacterium]
MNESQQTRTQTPWLERIQQHINGFQGYEYPEKRLREDERFRRYLDQLAADVISRVKQLVSSAAKEKRLDLLSDFEHMLSTLQQLQEALEPPPETLDGTTVVAPGLLAEWHREDCEYLECLSAFMDRIAQLPGPVPERNDVLLLLDTLDRLLQRIRERKKRGAESDLNEESKND